MSLRLGDIINQIDEIKKNVDEKIADSPAKSMAALKLNEVVLWICQCMPTELVEEGKQ